MNGLEEVAVNSEIPRYLLYYGFISLCSLILFDVCVMHVIEDVRSVSLMDLKNLLYI